jgi:hypothetical protein
MDRIDKDSFKRLVEFMSTNKNVSKEEAENIISGFGPKRLNKHGLLVDDGWRAGYTKQTIEKRKNKNRSKEKNRRKVRAAQRR